MSHPIQFAALLGLALAVAPLRAQGIVFDFDSTAAGTPLPVDVTVNGVNAHLSATGQGYSIQRADAHGFTPAGFAGNCVDPSSVFLADLRIEFSSTLANFSLLYAPEEYACDSSATLRATGYLAGVEVATRTTTAPNPGTWPTGVLTLDAVQGFDTLVAHYEAAPPTGGDWGPIFMADVMTVTTVADATVCADGFESGDFTYWTMVGP
jgi:hypothetical protein